MKTKFLLFIVSTVFGFHLFAGNVTLQQAQKVALNFYFEKHNQFEGQVSYDQLSIQPVYTETDGIQNFYYVFHISQGGFVMVSADDRLNPVLGYSFKHDFGIENQPPNVKWWLSQYSDQVKYAREKQLVPGNSVTGKWAYYLNNDFLLNKSIKESKEVEPLMTTLWDQGWPYNYYCPETPTGGSGGHVWAGCMATAIAQISYYWRWPDHGQGHTSYIPALHPEYGVQFADFENTWYRFDEMVDSPQTVNTAIAEYIYHYAVNMRMNFDPNGSAPDSSLLDPDQDSTAYHFKYFPYTWLYRDSMPDEEWKTTLVNMLNEACPIFYTGNPVNPPGHAFVCDGYQDEDHFHFNFGWSGESNGYYTIDSILGFNYNQMISSAFFPDTINFTYPLYCTGEDTCSGLEGSISDGSGPVKDYLNNTQASWLINPQTEFDSVTKIIIMVKRLDLYNDGDKLYIYDGENNSAPLLAELSGNNLPGNIESTGNQIFVEFITDGSNTAPGFYLNYKTVRPEDWCSNLTQLTQPTALFDDGSGDFYYYNSTACLWMIDPGITDPLTLHFNYFNTEEDYDILKIYDAVSQELLATLDGYYENPPEPITSSSGKIMLAFQSNSTIQGQGWEAWYDINTGIQDNVQDIGLSISPNPVAERFTINYYLDLPSFVQIEVYNFLGQKVDELTNEIQPGGIHKMEFNTVNIKKGVYLLKLTTSCNRNFTKFIKHD